MAEETPKAQQPPLPSNEGIPGEKPEAPAESDVVHAPERAPGPIATSWMNDGANQVIRIIHDDRRRRWFAAIAQQLVDPIGPPADGVSADRPGEATQHATSALYQEVLRRLSSVEEAMAALSQVRVGLGHNQPPEPIELVGFDNVDQDATEAAISLVRSPETPPAEARKAAAELARIGTKTKDYVVKQGDNFISEIVKAAALGTATMAGVALLDRHPVDYVLYLLAERLLNAADAIEAWLDLLGSLR